MTAELQESFCSSFPSTNIKQANIFISHAWGMRFLETVSAIQSWQEKNPTKKGFFWFDLFSNNQHQTEARDFTWWQTTFMENIREIGHTLLILEWEEPRPLTRAWCLWEMFSSVDTRSRFEVVMPPRSAGSFLKVLQEDFDSLVFKTCTVDVEKAQSFNPSDRENIFQAVRSSHGFLEINKRVIGIMKDWMILKGREALEDLPEEQRSTSILINNLARLLQEQGRAREAEPLFKEALEASRNAFGDLHPSTLRAVNNLGKLLHDLGKLEEAEPLLREAVKGYREAFGNFHPDTLTIVNNLAGLLREQGRLKEAEPFYKEVLEERRKALGDSHPSTLTSINNLAALLYNQRRLKEAEGLFEEAMEGRRKALGDSHPDTLGSINNLGMVLQEQGMLGGARLLYEEALEGRRKTLGDSHPSTLTSINNLALLLYSRGELKAAKPLLKEALEIATKVWGEQHPNTRAIKSNLGSLLEDLGE